MVKIHDNVYKEIVAIDALLQAHSITGISMSDIFNSGEFKFNLIGQNSELAKVLCGIHDGEVSCNSVSGVEIHQLRLASDDTKNINERDGGVYLDITIDVSGLWHISCDSETYLKNNQIHDQINDHYLKNLESDKYPDRIETEVYDSICITLGLFITPQMLDGIGILTLNGYSTIFDAYKFSGEYGDVDCGNGLRMH